MDLLRDAGEEGWELVAVLANGVAYLKRELDEDVTAAREESAPVEVGASPVQPKYRDPATGDTWSGRGRMATWLKRKLDAGEDKDKYLV
jgi:DNA-binding protein H-NS